MDYPKNIWAQLKNKTTADLISALEKDGFLLDGQIRTERIYRHSDGRRVAIHYHSSSSTFGPSLLKSLLEDIGWNVRDMVRLKLVKR